MHAPAHNSVVFGLTVLGDEETYAKDMDRKSAILILYFFIYFKPNFLITIVLLINKNLHSAVNNK